MWNHWGHFCHHLGPMARATKNEKPCPDEIIEPLDLAKQKDVCTSGHLSDVKTSLPCYPTSPVLCLKSVSMSFCHLGP